MISINRKIWKERILDIYIEYPEYNATQVRKCLIDSIGDKATPGKSAIQKEWARLRGENTSTSQEDAPWHLGSMSNYPVDNIALPALLAFQREESKHPGKQFSIRQAKWVARLHGVIEDRQQLISIARFYALREKASELSNQTVFDTVRYDVLLHDPGQLINYFEQEKEAPINIPVDTSENGSSSKDEYELIQEKESQTTHGSMPAHPSTPVTDESMKNGYLLVNELFFYGEKILIRINVRGTVKRVVLPFSSQEELMKQLQSEKMIDVINSIGKDVTHIVLNKPLSISTENKQFREYLLHETQQMDNKEKRGHN